MCLLIIAFTYVAWTGKKTRGIRITWVLWFGFLLAHAIFMPAFARLEEILTDTTPDVSPFIALGIALSVGGLLGSRILDIICCSVGKRYVTIF